MTLALMASSVAAKKLGPLPVLNATLSSVAQVEGHFYGASRCTNMVDPMAAHPGGNDRFCLSELNSVDPWLSIRVPEGSRIGSVAVFLRNNSCCRGNLLSPFEVWVGDAPGHPLRTKGSSKCTHQPCDQSHRATRALNDNGTFYVEEHWDPSGPPAPLIVSCGGVVGEYVTLSLPGVRRTLNVAQVQAFPCRGSSCQTVPQSLPPPPPPLPPLDKLAVNDLARVRTVLKATLREGGATNSPGLPKLLQPHAEASYAGFQLARRFRQYDFREYVPSAAERSLGLGPREYVACACDGCDTESTVFVHVFKSAGSSINAKMLASCGAQSHCMSLYASQCFGMGAMKNAVPLYDQCAPEPLSRAFGGFVFSVVREPIARFVSAVDELKRRGVLAENETVVGVLEMIQREGFFDAHIRPQYSFLVKGLSMERELEPLPIDYIARVEAMDGLELLLWGSHEGSKLNQVNPGRPAREVDATLRPEVRCVVAELYSLDYDLFGYELPAGCITSPPKRRRTSRSTSHPHGLAHSIIHASLTHSSGTSVGSVGPELSSVGRRLFRTLRGRR